MKLLHACKVLFTVRGGLLCIMLLSCEVIFASASFAQDFSIGAKGGAVLTADIHPTTISESKRYTIGPTVELKLSHGFSVEFDALYRRLGTGRSYQYAWFNYYSRDRSNSWEFPILAKYSFPTPLKLYVSGGYAFRAITGSGYTDALDTVDGSVSRLTYSTKYKNSFGFVVATGVEIRLGSLSFTPEFRYTRWTNKSRENFNQYLGLFENSTLNQAEILMGLSWHPIERNSDSK